MCNGQTMKLNNRSHQIFHFAASRASCSFSYQFWNLELPVCISLVNGSFDFSLTEVFIFIAGEYRQPDESVEMSKQASADFSSGELQPADRPNVALQASVSSGAKKGSQQRPMMGRVTSTMDSSARPRRHQFGSTGQC